jgi:Na+-translocating ferredoxin:NAD+ oxidoreductase subunit B
MSDVYEKLRQKLDDLSVGYPATPNKVEIKILKRLFKEEHAELFLHMLPILEEPAIIAERAGKDTEYVESLIEEMAKKGLVFRKRDKDRVRYSAPPFVIGIFEYQVNQMDKEMASDLEEYHDKAVMKIVQAFKTPLMRTIPVNKELVVKWPIAPYEDVLQIFDSQKTISVANCVCRTMGRLTESGCDKPIEACFSFGATADYYVENGMGRYVSADQAKQIVKENLEKAPLVMQPVNSQKIGGLCMCCGDCCGMLKSLKLQPNPAASVKSNYFAQVDDSKCEGCELCLERCQMEAIRLVDEIAIIDYDRCIGCGLCVPTCPGDALELIKKKEDDQYTPPENFMGTYMNIAKERGKI